MRDEPHHLTRLLTIFPALRSALDGGVDWESDADDWQPCLPEMYPFQSYVECFRDGETEYELTRVVRGARHSGGRVYEFRKLIDGEGDLREEDSCDLDNAGFPRWYTDCGPGGTVAAWRSYVEDVAKSGDDALGFLAIPPAADARSEVWQVRGESILDENARECLRVRRARRDRGERWLGLADMPHYVCVSLVGGRAGASDLIGIHGVEGLRNGDWRNRRLRPEVVPGSLEFGPRGAWAFLAIIDADPLALRARRAAREWLSRKRL